MGERQRTKQEFIHDAITRIRLEGLSVDSLTQFGWAFSSVTRQGICWTEDAIELVLKAALDREFPAAEVVERSERKLTIEEVRAAFAAAVATGQMDGAYLETRGLDNGCSTCGHGETRVLELSMNAVNTILDRLLVQPLRETEKVCGAKGFHGLLCTILLKEHDGKPHMNGRNKWLVD